MRDRVDPNEELGASTVKYSLRTVDGRPLPGELTTAHHDFQVDQSIIVYADPQSRVDPMLGPLRNPADPGWLLWSMAVVAAVLLLAAAWAGPNPYARR
jgi:hypothetical protein